jgi:ABC-type sugar transport system ATPase subunit
VVGVRPERLHLSHRVSEREAAGGVALHFPAKVMLREDLGGEDIVYLAANGVSLTMVDRDHYRGDDLDERVTISIFPHHLTLFAANTGQFIGRGARLAAGLARVGTREQHG